MSIARMAKNFEKFAVANSPSILTAIAVTGTVTTAILAGKASYKAAEQIAEAEGLRVDPLSEMQKGYQPLTREEKVKLVWMLYIPAAGSGITTVLAMIAANQIGTRRAAVMAAAYSMSEKAFGDYREKVVTKFGEKKEQVVRDEIAQDRVTKQPAEDRQVIMISEGQILCFEMHSGRYFNSDMESIKKAQNDLNYRILQDSYASLNDFYEKIGLEMVPSGEELGWTSDKPMELFITSVLSPDQRPCIAIDFAVAPVPNYYKGF